MPGLHPRQRHARDVVPHLRHTTGTCSVGSPAGHRRPGGSAMRKVQRRGLLCNGVLLFTGELLPDGQIIAPARCRAKAAA
ncbi:DUF5999 family protein [Streptomyces hygroscopicus]|uniref:DUF5999 family protein n=1 Tax=Streptomyces hygroscopicus TaxID=1912 RepID=UPI003D76A411